MSDRKLQAIARELMGATVANVHFSEGAAASLEFGEVVGQTKRHERELRELAIFIGWRWEAHVLETLSLKGRGSGCREAMQELVLTRPLEEVRIRPDGELSVRLGGGIEIVSRTLVSDEDDEEESEEDEDRLAEGCGGPRRDWWVSRLTREGGDEIL